MYTSTLMLLALTVVGPPVCRTEKPGPDCPAIGIRHAMVGIVNGEEVAFTGWHEAGGKRKWLPEENPVAMALKSAAAVLPPGRPGKNFGVSVDETSTAVGVMRTNDEPFGTAVNAELSGGSGPNESAIGNRPCPPGPNPCPNPIDIDPDPIPSVEGRSIAAIAGSVVLVVFAGAAVVAALVLCVFLFRRTTP
ncbi:MAG: hypothetical protein P4L84_11020 [Isosphaeraceae bacterium]|nr:hypothetical protein [Isosphaeraceae bacterium]